MAKTSQGKHKSGVVAIEGKSHSANAAHRKDGHSVTKSTPTMGDKESCQTNAALSKSPKYLVLTDYLTIVSIVIGLALRLFKLEHPHNTVFDEYHHLSFALLAVKRKFWFDVNPPMAKFFLILVAYLTGADSDKILDDQAAFIKDPQISFASFRLVGCGFWLLSAVILLSILKTLKVAPVYRLVAIFLLAIDNSNIVISRTAVLDTPFMFFSFLSLYSWLMFKDSKSKPFSLSWKCKLVLVGLSLGLCISTKMIGVFTVFTIMMFTIKDLYDLAGEKCGYNFKIFLDHSYRRLRWLAMAPLLIYYAATIILLLITNRSGNESSYLSPSFEFSLKGNRFEDGVYAVPLYSKVLIKFKDNGEYMLATKLKYPTIYPDGRVSSSGTIVSTHKDIEESSYWRIIPTDGPHVNMEEYDKAMNDPNYISYAVLQANMNFILQNLSTGCFLLFQDVASRFVPMDLEISCFDKDNNVSTPDNYKISLQKTLTESGLTNDIIYSSYTNVLVASQAHKSVLVIPEDQRHPELDKKYVDLRGVRVTSKKKSFATVEAIFPENTDKEIYSSKVLRSKSKKNPIKKMDIFNMASELIIASVSHSWSLKSAQSIVSRPFSWPLQHGTFSFWRSDNDSNKISYLGNPIIWAACFVSVLVAPILILGSIFERKLKLKILRDSTSSWIISSLGYLFTFWFNHWVLFFMLSRNLYSHHYLVSFVTSVLLLAAVLDSVSRSLHDVILYLYYGYYKKLQHKDIDSKSGMVEKNVKSIMLVSILTFAVIALYGTYSITPVTYGIGAPKAEDLKALNWHILPDIVDL